MAALLIAFTLLLGNFNGIFAFQHQLFATKNENITLPCNLSISNENATIQWKFKEQILAIGGKYNLVNDSLVINLISELDSGSYFCSSSANRNMSHEIRLNIQSSPLLTMTFPNQTNFESNNLTLQCVGKGLPIPEIFWMKNGKNISTSNGFVITLTKNATGNGMANSVISKSGLVVKDSGLYQCVISNIVDMVVYSGSVVVYGKPVDLTVSVGQVYGMHVIINWYRNENANQEPYTHTVEMALYLGDVLIRNLSKETTQWNSSLTITGLDMTTTYKIKGREMTAVNQTGPWSSLVEFTTSSLSIGPVTGLQARSTSPYLILVNWLRPDFVASDVVLGKYRVQYLYTDHNGITIEREKIINVTNVNLNSIILKDLQPAIEYSIIVSGGMTSLGGWGESTEIKATTKEAVPGAPAKLLLLDASSSYALIGWNPIPYEEQHGQIIYYTLTREGGEHISDYTQRINYTDNQSHVNLTQLYPNTRYTVAVSAVNGAGPGSATTLIFSTHEDAPSIPRGLIVTALDGFSINVIWLEPLISNGLLRQFEVVWQLYSANSRRKRQLSDPYAEQSIIGDIRSGKKRTFILEDLKPYNTYTIKVRESTSAGWGPYTQPQIISTPEASPGKVANATLLSRTKTTLTITWNIPLKPNGLILYYNVYVKDGASVIRIETVPSFSDNATGLYTHVIDGLNPNTLYLIEITAHNSLPGATGNALVIRTVTNEKVKSGGFPWLPFCLGFVGALLLIGIALVLYLFYSRRKKKIYEEVGKDTDDIPLDAVVRSRVIPSTELQNYCFQNHSNSDHGFYTEYESSRIPPNAHMFKWEHSQESFNQMKNRYSNIVAYDHTRVILKQIDRDPASAYINASYIDGYQQPKKYIATQGPLPNTINDFWRMIWEQNCHVIVMLTRLIEDSRVKCEQYWPVKGAARYGDMVVTIIGSIEMSDYVVRTFSVHSVIDPSEGKREVKQFHFTAWPDHGVPSHPTAMVNFVRHVMSAVPDRPWPVVIHCSAGVGRTGTFIVIEANLCRLKEEQSVDVLGFVLHIRSQRNFMVQTEGQYIFIYDALMDAVICGDTEIPAQDICARLRHLNEVDPDIDESYLMAEFKRLEYGAITAEKMQSSIALLPENKNKNRFFNVLPYDKNRVRLTPNAASRTSDYINASFVDGYQQRQAYIASQAPLTNTVTDFWQMIWEHNVSSVVMLTKLEEKQQEKCAQYWPKDEAGKFGGFHVECLEEKDYGEFISKDLRLSNIESGKSRTVRHFLFLGWPEYRAPSGGRDMIELIGQVQRSQQSRGNGPILVHCSGGVGRTGSYIAMSISIERLKVEGTIDLFQTVRALRMQRPAMVQTVDQYSFCYLSLNDYMDSFDLYSNFK